MHREIRTVQDPQMDERLTITSVDVWAEAELLVGENPDIRSSILRTEPIDVPAEGPFVHRAAAAEYEALLDLHATLGGLGVNRSEFCDRLIGHWAGRRSDKIHLLGVNMPAAFADLLVQRDATQLLRLGSPEFLESLLRHRPDLVTPRALAVYMERADDGARQKGLALLSAEVTAWPSQRRGSGR